MCLVPWYENRWNSQFIEVLPPRSLRNGGSNGVKILIAIYYGIAFATVTRNIYCDVGKDIVRAILGPPCSLCWPQGHQGIRFMGIRSQCNHALLGVASPSATQRHSPHEAFPAPPAFSSPQEWRHLLPWRAPANLPYLPRSLSRLLACALEEAARENSQGAEDVLYMAEDLLKWLPA